MPDTKPQPTVEQLRARVVNAFAELPTDAFDQAITLLCPAPTRTYRFSAFGNLQSGPFLVAVSAYFAAKQGE